VIKKLAIRIITESQVLIGSGEGWGSVIDSDVVMNKFGVPVFPGRRLKGLLKESAEEIYEIMEAWGRGTRFDPARVFGEAGRPAAIRVYNLGLQGGDEINKWLKWAFCYFGPQAGMTRENIISVFTEIRAQTAINDNGVAEENSLRVTRVLRKGLEFAGEIELAEPTDDDLILLGLACANLKWCGGKRNRGFGRIRCALYDGQKNLTEDAIAMLEGGSA